MKLSHASWKNYVTHLECSRTGKHYPHSRPIGLSDDGAPIIVRYDLDKIAKELKKEDLKNREDTLWKYQELLPLNNPDSIVSLGENFTPLIPTPNLGQGKIYIKDEGRLPTGSFKARGLCMAISMAKEFKIKKVAIPTNGNAGAAMAAYAKRAGMESYVFCPDDTPEINTVSYTHLRAHET